MNRIEVHFLGGARHDQQYAVIYRVHGTGARATPGQWRACSDASGHRLATATRQEAEAIAQSIRDGTRPAYIWFNERTVAIAEIP